MNLWRRLETRAYWRLLDRLTMADRFRIIERCQAAKCHYRACLTWRGWVLREIPDAKK